MIPIWFFPTHVCLSRHTLSVICTSHPQKVSLDASAMILFSVANNASFASGFFSNFSLIHCFVRGIAWRFQSQYLNPAMFLPRALISYGLSQLMILSAHSWSWNNIAFECWIYCSLQMYDVPLIVTGNLVFKLLKIESFAKITKYFTVFFFRHFSFSIRISWTVVADMTRFFASET